jgi:hypothetical protein
MQLLDGKDRNREDEMYYYKAVATEAQAVIAKLQLELDRKDELLKQYEDVVKMVMGNIETIKEKIHDANT